MVHQKSVVINMHINVFRLPFDEKTFLGWLYHWSVSFVGGIGYVNVNSCFLSLFIGISMYHRAYQKLCQSLIDRIAETNQPLECKNLLRTIIEMHLTAKDAFLQSAQIFSTCILVILMCSMVYLACSIFQLDLVSK